MELTRAHALHVRQDHSEIAFDTMIIVLGILAICLVAMAPMIWMLVWMRNDGNPDCMRRQPQRQDVLPATTTGRSSPTQNLRPRMALLFLVAGKARLVASRLRGVTVAAGHATFLKLQERLAKLSPTSLLRRPRRRNASSKTAAAADSTYDLPIMRKPAWQRLAESHTSCTVGRPGKDAAGEERPSRAEGGADVHVQKPEAAFAVE